MADPSKLLSTLISASAVLLGSEPKTHSPDLATVLKTRLARAREVLQEGENDNVSESSLQVVQYITAKESLRLLERMQSLLDPDDVPGSGSGSGSSPPLLGTRDLSYVRTLLPVIFNWGVTPLIAELGLNLPGHQAHGSPTLSGEPRIRDLTERLLDFEELPVMMLRLLRLLFGQTKIRQTWITTSILSQHAVDLLTPSLVVGWAPKPVSEMSVSISRQSKDVKALAIRFLNVLRSHEAIAALGAILSSSSINIKLLGFPYVSRACRYLLSKQLGRPDGVRGLCIAMFGDDDEDGDVAPLDKLEHISRVLGSVPANANPQEYYQSIIHRVLAILLPSSPSQQESPQSHKRAAAFTLSRMLSASSQHRAITSEILLPLFHQPFLFPATESGLAVPPSESTSQPTSHLTPMEALQTLQAFLLHADPSPAEISTLLTPIVPDLYTLASLHRSSKTADPNVRESLNALLSTWGRIVSASDAIDGLWRIITGSGGNWKLTLEGFMRLSQPAPPPSISLLAAADIEASTRDEVDINANPFNLQPDPSAFVAFAKTLDRKDVSPEIFVRLLNEYRDLNDGEEEPIRTLLYLQLILQMQTQLSTTVLSKPEHVLSFIKHALGSESSSFNRTSVDTTFKKGLGLKDLRIVAESVSEATTNDSDDEEEDEETDDTGGGKDGILETAITLLLSVLEANADLSPQNAPDLGDIFTSLDHLTSHTSPTIRQLAREARLVLMSRMASTSAAAVAGASRSTTQTKTESESPHATYQKALKLLQDPIIPVRAHGLRLLRELVARPSRSQPGNVPRPPGQTQRSEGMHDWERLDPALMPGILSIFLQSIQDDESYIFLNAVQGLVAMVDGHGREVLRGIVEVYLSGTGVGGSGVAGGGGGGTAMTKQELDARIRVGEALNTVVKRCGGALGLYVGILVPPLLTILQSSHLPTTLRVSALSILAQCVATNALALNVYTPRLADCCVELIQLESVSAKRTPANPKPSNDNSFSTTQNSTADDDKTDEDQTGGPKRAARAPDLMDSNPTTKNTKAAPLRRTALHFLSQLLRAYIASLYDSRTTPTVGPSVTLNVGGSRIIGVEMRADVIPAALLRRARVVLGYVAATDEDSVARVMAREALELVEQYKEASLGF